MVTGQVSIYKEITEDKFSLLNRDLKIKCKPAISSQTLDKHRTALADSPEPALKLFEGELCGYPVCLAEDEESLYHVTESKMKKRLETCSAPTITPESSIIVVELSLVHQLAEKPAKNFMTLLLWFTSLL